MGTDTEKNLASAEKAVRDGARQGATMGCLPELLRTPYFPRREDTDRFDLAEPVPGPTTERIGKLAAELGVVIVTPVFERRAAGLYHNTAVVLDSDGSTAGV